MKTRRNFTREFKLSVLQELECKPAAQICREHNVHPNMLSRWKKEYDENPKEAFSGKGKIWKEDAKIAQYERLVGQLYAENAFLKKALNTLQMRRAEGRRKR